MSEDTGVDVDDVVGLVERQIALARAQAERANEFHDQVKATLGFSASPRREVSVTVDATGRLAGVELTHAAMRMHPQTLARLLVDTAEVARRTAGQRVLRLAQDAFGCDSDVVERLREEVHAPPPSVVAGWQGER